MIAFVTDAVASAGLNTSQLTVNISPGSGNTLLLSVGNHNTNNNPATVSSVVCKNSSNSDVAGTWTRLANQQVTSGTFRGNTELWVCSDFAGNTAKVVITFSTSGASTVVNANVSEWSGLYSPTVVVGPTVGTDTTTGNVSTSSIAPTLSDGSQLQIAIAGGGNNADPSTNPSSPWNSLTRPTIQVTGRFLVGSYIVAADTTSRGATWTTASTSQATAWAILVLNAGTPTGFSGWGIPL